MRSNLLKVAALVLGIASSVAAYARPSMPLPPGARPSMPLPPGARPSMPLPPGVRPSMPLPPG